ncbi:MAG: endonuclease domain-containing protein [Patescibacteria group bacterium]
MAYTEEVALVYTRKDSEFTRSVLRKRMTAPELVFWTAVRNRKLKGYKFRRQYSAGRYVIDFYCSKVRLGIEIDGDSHFQDEQKQYDAVRQEYIDSLGIEILRYTNDEIMKNLSGVLEDVSKRLP